MRGHLKNRNVETNVLSYMCHHAISTAIRLLIIPPTLEITHCLTHVLFDTLITGKEIHQAFAITAKLLVYSMFFLYQSLQKISYFHLNSWCGNQVKLRYFSQSMLCETVRLNNICTNLATCCVKVFYLSDFFKAYCLTLTKYVVSFLELLKETIGPGLERSLSSSFIYKG